MKRRTWLWIARSALIVLAILLIAALIVVAILFSPVTLPLLTNKIKKEIPELHFSKVTGTVYGPLTFYNVRYQHGLYEVRAQKVYLVWDVMKLGHHHLYVEKVYGDNVEIVQTGKINTTNKKAQKIYGNIPKRGYVIQDVNIKDLKINNLNLRTLDVPLGLNFVQIKGAGKWDKKELALQSQGHLGQGLETDYDLKVAGTPSRYQANLLLKDPQGSFGVVGEGDQDHVLLKPDNTSGSVAPLTGFIDLTWAPVSAWRTDLKINNLNINQWSSAFYKWLLPMGVDLRCTGHGNFDQGVLKVQVEKAACMGMPFTGKGTFAYQPDRTAQFTADLNTQTGHATVEGHLKKHWNLHWQAQIADFAKQGDNTLGDIKTAGDYNQQGQGTHLQGDLHVQGLHFLSNSLKNGHLKYNVHWDRTPSTIGMQLSGLQYQAWDADALNMHLNGTFKHHQILGDVKAGAYKGALRVEGGLLHQAWRGQVLGLDLQKVQQTPAVHWKLATPVDVIATPKNVDVHAFHWQSQPQAILGSAHWQSDSGLAFDLSAQRLQLGALLQSFSSIFPETMIANLHLKAKNQLCTYQGELELGEATLAVFGSTQLQAGWHTQMELEQQNLHLMHPPTYDVVLSPSVRLTLDQNNLQWVAKVPLVKAQFRSSRLPDFFEWLNLGMNKLQQFKTPSANFPWQTSGQVTVDLGKDTRLDTDSLNGKITGSMLIDKQPAQDFTVQGQWLLKEGSYLLQKTPFRIKEGAIFFPKESLLDPKMNIKAEYKIPLRGPLSHQGKSIKPLVATLGVEGSVTAPHFELASTPGGESNEQLEQLKRRVEELSPGASSSPQ